MELTIIFLFIFTLICIENIRHSIYAVVFLMPLYLLRFSIFGIPTTVLEIMIYVLFLVWIFKKILKQYHSIYYDTVHLNRNNKMLLVGISLLFLGLTISTSNSSDLRTSLGIFKGWFFDPFLFFIVFISVIKKEKHLIISLKSWLASGVVVSLISIFYLLNNNLTFDGRLKAFFLSPNHLAMYLAPAFLIGLFFLLNKKKVSSIKYLVLSISLIIILIPLYFTYSYGAFLGIFVAIIYLFYKNNLSFSQRWKSIATINIKYSIFLIIIFASFIFITSNRFNQIINSENRSSFHSRLMVWNASVEIIKDNPFFGIGPGTFQDAYLLYSEKFEKPYLEWAVPQPHNIFLAFYLQTGIIGFAGFILILLWFFNRRRDGDLSRLDNKDAINQDAINCVSTIMIYILIHGLVDTTYWKNDLAFMLWLIIGMMIVSKKINK